MSEKLDTIWDGDYFERRAEAELLEQYLESIWQVPYSREESKGFVLAVDADYGMGKTFFLTRFAKQMALNHPVAYIDAWKDDLQDEPLIALISTLEKALEDAFGTESGDITDAKNEVWEKVKKVSGIVGKGVLKKAAGLIITATAADAAANILEGRYEDLQEVVKKEIEDIGKDSVNGVVTISKVVGESNSLEEKIKSFREGQQTIDELKKALSSLVGAVSKGGKQEPIVIIIDELDRCRPNYAIKLLEEIKHLFDVGGIVFVLGTNLNQTIESVKSIYGNEFDAHSYLNRFTNRKYKLKDANHQQIISVLVDELKIDQGRFHVGSVIDKYNNEICDFTSVLNKIAEYYKISTRDIFRLMLDLKTCISITRDRYHLLYLVQTWLILNNSPSIIEKSIATNNDIFYGIWENNETVGRGWQRFAFKDVYDCTNNLVNLSRDEILKLINDGTSLEKRVITEYGYLNSRGNPFNIDQHDANPKNYHIVINKAARFTI